MGIKEAGYNYFFDPLISVYGKIFPMTAGCIIKDQGIVMTGMAVPFMVDQILTASSFRFWRLFEARKTMRIMIKIRDDLCGRLTDSGWVVKKLSPADKEPLFTK